MTVGNWIEITIALSIVIQIAPIKIDPWSWLFKRIGKIANEDIAKSVAEIDKKLNDYIKEDREDKAKQARTRILRFNDELIQGDKHTKEHFDCIMIDITEYKAYCKENPLFENNIAVMAIENIERVYRCCMAEGTFL